MRTPSTPIAAFVAAAALVLPLAACTSSTDTDAADAVASDTALTSAGSSLDGLGSQGSSNPGGGEIPVGDEEPPHRGSIEVVATHPHDPRLFTQGLEIARDRIYESTGQRGSSIVQHRPWDGAEGDVVEVPLPGQFFGEGVTVTEDTVWNITWQAGVAIERDPETLEEIRQVRYEGEGWGLCNDGERIVMSDGTPTLTFRDLETFDEIGSVQVTAGGRPLRKLNELDCSDGHVYANVWQTDDIVKIDPATGTVVSVYSGADLEQPRPNDPEATFNGVAHIPGTDRYLVTGKLWETVYEVRFVD